MVIMFIVYVIYCYWREIKIFIMLIPFYLRSIICCRKIQYIFVRNYLFFVSYNVVELFLKFYKNKKSFFDYFFRKNIKTPTFIEFVGIGVIISYLPILIVGEEVMYYNKVGVYKYKDLIYSIYNNYISKIIMVIIEKLKFYEYVVEIIKSVFSRK